MIYCTSFCPFSIARNRQLRALNSWDSCDLLGTPGKFFPAFGSFTSYQALLCAVLGGCDLFWSCLSYVIRAAGALGVCRGKGQGGCFSLRVLLHPSPHTVPCCPSVSCYPRKPGALTDPLCSSTGHCAVDPMPLAPISPSPVCFRLHAPISLRSAG